MSDLRYPTWQEPVRLAFQVKMQAAFNAAFAAIEARRSELRGDADHREERIALQDAVTMLNLVWSKR
jgi:hypothetical protein